MSPAALVVVGQIAGAFGVRGEVRVRSFTEEPGACLGYGPLMDETGTVVLTPVSARPLKDVFAVTSREDRTREDWEALRGTLLHAPRHALPPPKADETYVVDLIGCEVRHVDGRALGRVQDVQNYGAGDLLEIETAAGERFLLPFTRGNAPSVAPEQKLILVDPPEALLPEGCQRQASDGGTN